MAGNGRSFGGIIACGEPDAFVQRQGGNAQPMPTVITAGSEPPATPVWPRWTTSGFKS